MKKDSIFLSKENIAIINEIDYLKFQNKLLTQHANNLKKIIGKQIKTARTFRAWQFYCNIRKLIKAAIKNPRDFRKYYHLFRNKNTKKLVKKISLALHQAMLVNDSNENYQLWNNKNLLKHTNVINKIQNLFFKKRPLFSLIVKTDNMSPKIILQTLESITKQYYKKWETIVIISPKKYHVISHNEFFTFYKKKIKIVTDNTYLPYIKGDFGAVIQEGIFLWPNLLFETVKLVNKNPWSKFIYFDEDKIDDKQNNFDPFFKPDWSPDYLRSTNYIGRLAFIDIKLFKKNFANLNQIDNYYLYLKTADYLTKKVNCHPINPISPIQHIAKILFSQIDEKTNTRRSDLTKILKKSLSRIYPSTYIFKAGESCVRVKYPINNNPSVSIIIPTKNQYYFLNKCLNSIVKNTTYNNYELVIVDTGSTDEIIKNSLDEIKRQFKRTEILSWNEKFNFSSVCNYGANQSNGDYLLFLNNDTEIITPNWIQTMLEHAQRKDIGAVGCKLLYPNKAIQHAGVILGIKDGTIKKGVAGHVFKRYFDNQLTKYYHFYDVIKNYSAVTAACMMISRKKFTLVNGFDEELRIAFNDIDFCLKLLKNNLYNLYTPYAKLYHYESISIGRPEFGERDIFEFQREIDLMYKKWGYLLSSDPFYNLNYSLYKANFRL